MAETFRLNSSQSTIHAVQIRLRVRHMLTDSDEENRLVEHNLSAHTIRILTPVFLTRQPQLQNLLLQLETIAGKARLGIRIKGTSEQTQISFPIVHFAFRVVLIPGRINISFLDHCQTKLEEVDASPISPRRLLWTIAGICVDSTQNITLPVVENHPTHCTSVFASSIIHERQPSLVGKARKRAKHAAARNKTRMFGE